MKWFLYIFVATFAFVGANEITDNSGEVWTDVIIDNEYVAPEIQGWILNSQAKKAFKNFISQLPCGWPEKGIPPLAPYTNPDLELHMQRSVVESFLQFIRFRFDGLDDIDIKYLKVSYTFSQKVKFHFVFRKLKATSARFVTDTLVDVLEKLGISVEYEGSGPLEFAVDSISLKGQFKYKMPILWGSIKIYKFKCELTVGSVTSKIGGILGNGKFNHLINAKIEKAIPEFINGNQPEISAHIEKTFVPIINAKLKGKNIWTILGRIFKSTRKCEPTPAPWTIDTKKF